ncbi:hypothetical protein OTK49_01800 [Vibrio coralliirubri]|uniref:hypothetical protein n=1 Tax=Vibrio coralliirubri TaxID=1516159 RepID=UPI00228489B8|nr:hypothetical protein [Vibrio coralliirubri]MCY9861247.1 hypothetical protein [Vibrio coralliirubri]
MLTPEKLEKLKNLATKELKTSQHLSEQLHDNFGDTIPLNTMVDVSAANLAYMNNVIAEFSKVKLELITILDAKSVRIGEDLVIDDPRMMGMYQLGITAALELIMNPNVDFI